MKSCLNKKLTNGRVFGELQQDAGIDYFSNIIKDVWKEFVKRNEKNLNSGIKPSGQVVRIKTHFM